MRTTALALLTLVSTGCIIQEAAPPIGQALPTADNVRIKLPEGAEAQALGQLADYYVITRNVSRDLNGGAAWVLIWVHAVVQFPPTTVDGDTYTWGPGSNALDPAEHRLVVVDNGDGTYDWSLDGRSKLDPSAEFEPVIYGHAVPGAIAHRGSGSFVLDFDAAERVNPIDNDAVGTVTVVYDLEPEGVDLAGTLDMIIDTRELDGDGVEQDVHFEYGYAERTDGSGELSFAIHGDLDDDGALVEDALIRSRWLATGAGRADVRVQGGDLGALVVEASECWSTSFGRTYYADNQGWMPTEGSEADCAFAEADLPGE